LSFPRFPFHGLRCASPMATVRGPVGAWMGAIVGLTSTALGLFYRLSFSDVHLATTLVPTQPMTPMAPVTMRPATRAYSRTSPPRSSIRTDDANRAIARRRREAGSRASRRNFRISTSDIGQQMLFCPSNNAFPAGTILGCCNFARRCAISGH